MRHRKRRNALQSVFRYSVFSLPSATEFSLCFTSLALRSTPTEQTLADAYYVLRDPTRRKEYDGLRGTRSRSERSTDPTSSANFFANFADFFSGASAASGSGGAGTDARGRAQRPDAEGVFGDVFEEVSRLFQFLVIDF